MHFLLIIAHDEEFRPSEDLISSIYQWIKDNSRRGIRIHGAPLKPSAEAISVQPRDGALSTRSGPFSDSNDQIAAFELIECANIEEAVSIASTHPMAAEATIEVRPVWSDIASQEAMMSSKLLVLSPLNVVQQVFRTPLPNGNPWRPWLISWQSLTSVRFSNVIRASGSLMFPDE